jgi:3-deoxy-manno-octulosonate cytidylyltransferase (CMP-KDO synthetase)
MDALVIIPARYASQRFPGKPLVPLTSPGGVERPLIEWTWRAAVAAVGPEAVVVATDDARIARVVEQFGGRAVMTSPDLVNGTERCAAAVEALDHPAEIVVNFQGDSPLLPAGSITPLVAALRAGKAELATPFVTCDQAMSAMILAEHSAGRVGGTCVVTRGDGSAAYFSKLPIPHGAGRDLPLKLHLGLYAYTRAALRAYAALPPSPLEQAEGLEQLRLLEAGHAIAMVEIPMPDGGIWEVNNPEDVAVVSARLA